MNNGFFEALSLLGSENSVDTEIIVEKVKSAPVSYTHLDVYKRQILCLLACRAL